MSPSPAPRAYVSRAPVSDPDDGTGGRRALGIPSTIGMLAGAALAFFGFFWILDLWIAGRVDEAATGGISAFLDFDTETLQNTLGSLASIIVAVFGIAITVVSIVVQLAATRYSSHIARMFFHDRKNLAIMSFFVVASLDVVWVSLGIRSDYVPEWSVGVSLIVLSGSLLLLIPYFAYVFDFLDPAGIVARIGNLILRAATEHRTPEHRMGQRQADAAQSVEHLADVAVNALSNKDKVIAARAIATLRHVLTTYLGQKQRIANEATGASWFRIAGRLQTDPDFAAMEPASQAQIESDRVWFEWKALRQLRNIFTEALSHLPEAAHIVAIATRQVGSAALAAGDKPAAAATFKFFNTFLRTSLNARDIRAAYNVFNEYRHLAEDVMDSEEAEFLLEVANYFRYYGQSAHAMGMGFVTETAAYDLSVLCERAFDSNSPAHADLLKIFLEVDKEAETKAEEKALRGVRKAQIRLATYYIVRGAEAHARTIFEDMRTEDRGRLESLRHELLAVKSKDFWEVTDRGVNFDYLDAQRKAALDGFFAWFGA
jgi:Predicted membrane protein (DUF2254)